MNLPHLNPNNCTIIPLTWENMAQGIMDDCLKCPVALALLPYAPKHTRPEVGSEYLFLAKTQHHPKAKLPPYFVDKYKLTYRLSAWISDFDNDDYCPEPFNLVISRKNKEIGIQLNQNFQRGIYEYR